jgi:phosphate transport system substrate-binding protein
MRWTVVLMALLVLAGAARAEDEPATGDVIEALRGKPEEARKAYLAGFTEAQLGRILDRFMQADSGSWARRDVSRALGWRVLDRRVARLRASAPSEEALAGAPRLTVLTYPRTDGSTSTIPLERLVACRLFGAPYVWGGPEELRSLRDPFVAPPMGGPIGLGGKRRDRPTLAYRAARCAIVADPTAPGNERLAKVINHLLVRHTGTHGAWVNLVERKADLILVARAPSPDETKLAAEKGVELEFVPVARDAFVFLVNRINPVESLTLDQIRWIYTHGNTSWNKYGGPDERIDAFQRNRNSGSQELFLDRVMGDTAPTMPPKELIRDSMIGPYNAVGDRAHALGYTVWYYERYMASLPEVRPLAIAGVRPTPETVADGTYPIVTNVYAAIRADEPADSLARRLRNWLLTDAGQAVVAESGYVPIR